MRRFPPFEALVTFEAVARHKSFTRAAAELNLTQSAVSHRIRKLETHLNVPLFLRETTGPTLSNAGAMLLKNVTPILSTLGGLSSAINGKADTDCPIRLGVGSALFTFWLARRLQKLRKLQPSLRLEIVSLSSFEQADQVRPDIAILPVRIGHVLDPETERFLFAEDVFPVCSPNLLNGRDNPTFADLAASGVVRYKQHFASEMEWSWDVWFNRFGRPDMKKVKESPLYDTLSMALTATFEGEGLGLGRSVIVADALKDGKLVRPCLPQISMSYSRQHIVRWTAKSQNDERVIETIAWLRHISRKHRNFDEPHHPPEKM